MSEYLLTVYYDGLCPLCSKEITHYKRLTNSHLIHFSDITLDSFDPVREGLDPYKIHQSIHGRDENGNLIIGVDVFVEIWKILPRYKLLSEIFRYRIIKSIAKFGYWIFAKIRPLLPRNKRDCESSKYCN